MYIMRNLKFQALIMIFSSNRVNSSGQKFTFAFAHSMRVVGTQKQFPMSSDLQMQCFYCSTAAINIDVYLTKRDFSTIVRAR